MKAILSAIVEDDRRLLSTARNYYLRNFNLEKDYEKEKQFDSLFDIFMRKSDIDKFICS